MNKLRNFIRVIAVLIFTSILTCFALIGGMKVSFEEQVVNAVENPTLSIDYTAENGYAKPNTSGTIIFTFKLDAAPVSDVYVEFRADDMTAVSAAGDYYYITDDFSALSVTEKVEKTHANSYITLNASNYMGVSLSYKVDTMKYAFYCGDTLGFNYFNFVITNIEGASYNGVRTIKCRMAYKNYIEMKKDAVNSNYYVEAFRTQNQQDFSFDLPNKSDSRAEKNVNNNTFGNSGSSLYQTYINQGWGQFEIYGVVTHMSANVHGTNKTKVYLYYGANIVVSDEYSGMGSGGANYDDDDSLKGDIDKDKYVDYYTEKESWHTHTVLRIPASYGYAYKVYIDNRGTSLSRKGNGHIKERLSDNVAPELLNTYLDTNTLNEDGKIRLMLRFSELVSGANSTINAYLDLNNVIFRYAEGNGTNTLVYEANLKTSDLMGANVAFKNITLDKFDGKVYDCGYNWQNRSANAATIKYNAKKIECNIDLRNPKFGNEKTEGAQNATKTRQVSVEVYDVTVGKFYYYWSKDEAITYSTAEDFEKLIKDPTTSDFAGYKEFNFTRASGTGVIVVGSPLGLNGEYYLHALVVSGFGKTKTATFGYGKAGSLISGYRFDNTIPTLSINKDSSSDQFNKVYNFTINDKYKGGLTENPAGISLIGVKIYEETTSEIVNDICLWDESSNIKLYDNGNITDGEYTGQFKFVINAETLELKVKDKVLTTLATAGYGTYYYSFYAEDKAGNTTVLDSIVYNSEKYDTRTQFMCSWSANTSNLYSEIDGYMTTGMDQNVYNIYDDSNGNLILYFQNEEQVVSTVKSDVMSIYRVYYGNTNNVIYEDGTGNYDEYLAVTPVAEAGGKKTNLKIHPLVPGYFKIEFVVDRTLTNNSTSKLYTMDLFEFYFTDRKFDQTTYSYTHENTRNYINSRNDISLINKVFQLTNNYYYMNSTEKVTTEPYNNSSSPASFSSVNYATAYVKYMEYQDLQLTVIDAQMAGFLNNGGSTKYQKADGQEAITAVSGQTWIRYKRSSWSEGNSLEGWAYYYYSSRNESSINTTLINSNCPLLTNAINTVVDYLVKKGTWVYLTEEAYFDKNNCPYLAPGQIHKDIESVQATKTGSNYSVVLSYEGDDGMYLNDTVIGDSSYPIASCLKLDLNEITKLYYYNEVTKDIVPINGENILTAVGDSIGSGLLRLIELDENGVCEFYVVLDVDAPVVSISWEVLGKSTQTTVSNDLNKKNDGEVYSAKSMTISGSKYTSELDSLAYVAVYEAPTYRFVSITYYSNLAEEPIILENGNYYVVVGDRYGNAYQFKVQVCDTEFEATVTVIDNSYVLVETNRSEDQIERFEVRINNVLQTKEYSEKGVKYTDDGYYNIYIKDIYGFTNSKNGEFGENCLFERELPKLTWYYLNTNDAYSPYIEDKTTSMNINFQHETNTYYVNTSRWLKFTFEEDYQYEFSGISNTYVQSSTHYVSINTSDNWTMKIWYTEFPNVVATYVCTNDSTAPTISCSYKSSTYELAERSTMDKLAPSSLINSVYYLTNIQFNKVGTSTENIYENGWVEANLITVKASDNSGISSVLIYLDNELYKEYLDVNGEFTGCSLSRTGEYKIVATDNFGNVKTFTFTNKSKEMIRASIDGEAILSKDTLLYGNTSTKFTLSENGQIYIKVRDYSLIFTLRDGKLIYSSFINTDFGNGDKNYEVTLKQKTIVNDLGIDEVVDDYFFICDNNEFKTDTLYEFYANNQNVQLTSKFKDLNGIKFYISYLKNGEITIQFDSDDVDKLNLEFNVLFDNEKEPHCYTVELSKETTDITLQTRSGININCEDEQVVRTNVDFLIDSQSANNLSEINKISYSYSATKEFIEYNLIYEKQGLVKEFDTSVNGFYSFLITNKYGNTINYIVNRSDEYTILAYAIYDDYVESAFDNSYGDELIKANNKIRFEAYTDYDDRNQFVLKKSGSDEAINFPYTYDNGYYIFTFDTAGIYQLTATDSFGNSVVKNFEINKSNIKYNENYLEGFNKNALLFDKGYTNQALTVKLDAIQADNIQYVSYSTSTENTVNGYKVVKKVETILYNELTQDAVGLNSKYAWVITYEYTYYTDTATLTKKTKQIVDLLTKEVLEENDLNKQLVKTNSEFSTKLEGAIGRDGDNEYEVIFRDSYGSIAKKDVNYKGTSTLTITRQTRSESKPQEINITDAVNSGVYCNGNIVFETSSKKWVCTKITNGEREQVNTMPLTFAFSAENGTGSFSYVVEYADEYGNNYEIHVYLVRQTLYTYLSPEIETTMIDNVETTRNNVSLSFSIGALCTYRLDSGEEKYYNKNEVLYRDGTYRFTVYDYAGNIATRVIRKDTTCEYEFKVGTTGKTLINGDVVNSGTVKFSPINGDTTVIKAIYRNNELQTNETTSFSKDGLWTILVTDSIGNIELFEFNIITHKKSSFDYTTPFTYKITEFWYNSGDGIMIDCLELVNHSDTNNNSSFSIKENGIYTVVMSSTIMQNSIDFVFTIDTSIPNTTLNGCEEGERTNNDITFDNINKGDIVDIYRNGELYKSVEITEKGDIPVISEGGEYRVVITNEAGVSTTLNFTRNNIANTAGSVLIIVICLLFSVGILVGSIIHNHQKVDD